jgi:hypothetical protein
LSTIILRIVLIFRIGLRDYRYDCPREACAPTNLINV